MGLRKQIKDFNLDEILEEKMLFPFFFIIYFVLAVYEHNIGQVSTNAILLPLGILLTGTALFYYALNRFIGDKKKAGLVTFIFALSGLTYGLQVELLVSGQTFEVLGINWASGIYLVLGNVIASTFLAYKILRGQLALKNPVRIANIVTGFLIIIVIINIAAFNFGITEDTGLKNDLKIDGESPENRPDIYYIVPDRYARNDILNQQYNFNNSNFTNSLEQRNFYIANESNANYLPHSYTSLASSLNLEHIESMKQGPNTSKGDFKDILDDNRAHEFLKARGYSYYHIGFDYYFTGNIEGADKNYNAYDDNYFTRGPFFTQVMSNSMVWRISNHLNLNPLNPSSQEKRRNVRNNFNSLKSISEKEGPKFVTAHYRMPHSPFIFDGNRERLSNEDNLTRDKKYIKQLQSTSSFLLEGIDEIDSGNSVIIIQSDEGPGLPPWEKDYAEKDIRKKTAILNAIHAPGINESKFYPQMTPVNTFRIIFNEYFGSDLNLQEDKTYLKIREGGHNFEQVNKSLLYPIN